MVDDDDARFTEEETADGIGAYAPKGGEFGDG